MIAIQERELLPWPVPDLDVDDRQPLRLAPATRAAFKRVGEIGERKPIRGIDHERVASLVGELEDGSRGSQLADPRAPEWAEAQRRALAARVNRHGRCIPTRYGKCSLKRGVEACGALLIDHLVARQ